MNILIVKCFPIEVNLSKKTYNLQEIGLASAFLKKGHNVSILFYSSIKKEPETYITTFGKINIYYQTPKILLFKYFLILKDFSSFASTFDLIITCEYSQIDSYKLVKSFPKKTIIYHGPYFSKTKIKYNFYTWFYDLVLLKKLRKLKPFICTKSVLATEYLQKKGLYVNKTVGVGLDIANLHNHSLYTINNIKDSDYLLYIGKIEKRRNIIFLIDLMKKLCEKKNNIKLIIIGKGDKKYFNKVCKHIKDCHLEKNITLIDAIEQSKLMEYYNKCSWFLLPTNYEIWGMVLMEAIYFNKPIITTYNGGSSSLIQNEKNGYILDLNIDKWADIILNHKIDYCQLKKTNTDILNEYNWDNISKSMIEVILSNE